MEIRYSRGVACFILLFLLFLGYTLLKDDCDKRHIRSEVSDLYFFNDRGLQHQTDTIWPMPYSVVRHDDNYVVRPSKFKFVYTSVSHKCSDVDDAVERYKKIIFGTRPKETSNAVQGAKNLDRLYIHVSAPCEHYPKLNSSENYVLVVKGVGMLTAHSQWGILRGLETFSQLVHRSDNGALVVGGVSIEDFPRFKHRGLMIDTGRHYFPVDVILQNLELMSYNKLNVFHWHMTDHESFPIKFKKFSGIAEMGAFHPSLVYTEEDIQRIVEFARKRGIRVIPEIDFPGHSLALSKYKPQIFQTCIVQSEGQNSETSVTLNPLFPSSFMFIESLYTELKRLFPDEYLHIGGDEVSTDCWRADYKFLKFREFTQTTLDEIQLLMIEGLLQEARKLNKKPIAWNDAFNHGYTATPATVQVWTGSVMGRPAQIVGDLTDGGTNVIVSYPWYLDSTPKKQWRMFYTQDLAEDAVFEDRILGGEVCAWTEKVDERNIVQEIWPMTSLAAERFWSRKDVNNIYDAERRMKNYECILKNRGAPISSISPGNCFVDWDWS